MTDAPMTDAGTPFRSPDLATNPATDPATNLATHRATCLEHGPLKTQGVRAARPLSAAVRLGLTLGLGFGLGSLGLGSCAQLKSDPVATAPVLNLDLIATQVHQLTNEQRMTHNLRPLSEDAALATIARTHSQDMADREFFDHVTPEGVTPSDRGFAANYRCRKDYPGYYTEGIAENLYMTDRFHSVTTYNGVPAAYRWMTELEVAEATVQGWMESPGHRENILTETYDREGIGVVLDPETHKIYVTQNFC
ncbi:MAG: CAP domain-containing protein [Prochlorothrix sp.]|nr:CAP domain-containing protein [Prochlorothrix sp.]